MKRALAALLACVALTPPVGDALARSGPSSSESARKGIERLLQERAQAVVAGDEAAFMSTISRDSPAFVARQRSLFRSMEQLDFASYRLEAVWERYGDLAGGFEVGDYRDAEAIALPVTDESLRIQGFDEKPQSEELFYTFVKRDGEWSIAEDTDLERFGFQSVRHLWDGGPLVATRSRHFLLLQHTCAAKVGCVSVPDNLLSQAEAALRRVRPYWKSPWSKHVVVLVPSSEEELQRMLGVTFDVSSFVAFAFGSSSPRIVVNPPSLEGRSDESVLSVLTHELLHVATRPASGRFTPLFVEEGFADYAGRADDPGALDLLQSAIVNGEFDGVIPQDSDFSTGTATDIFLTYQESHSAIQFFIETWGMRKFVRFYNRLGAIDVAPGTSGYHVDAVLKKTIGIGYGEFEKRWADSLEG